MDKKQDWLFHGFSEISDSGVLSETSEKRVRRSVTVKHEPTQTKFRMDVVSGLSRSVIGWSELRAWDGNDWFLVVKARTDAGFDWADGMVAPFVRIPATGEAPDNVFDWTLGTLCGIAAKFVSTKDGTIYETGCNSLKTFYVDHSARYYFAQRVFAVGGKVFSVSVTLDDEKWDLCEATLEKFGSKEPVRRETADFFERHAKGVFGYDSIKTCVHGTFEDFSRTAKNSLN